MAAKTKNKFLTYKGKPLVRCKDTIYYGNTFDPYIIKIQIKSSKNTNGLDISDKVTIELLNTDPNVKGKRKIIKSSEKEGLYLAMDIADIWLSRALEK